MTRPSCDFAEGLRHARNPAYATDENNHIIAWNRAAERLLGHHAEHAVGSACHELIAGTDIYGNVFCHSRCSVLKMVRRDQIVKRFDMNLRHASGNEVPAHCTILVIPEPSTSRFSIIHLLEAVEEEPDRISLTETSPPGCVPPHQAAGDAPAALTPREQQIIRLLATGNGTREIAGSLSISTTTVRTHIRNLLVKLGAHSRLEAVMRAFRDQII